MTSLEWEVLALGLAVGLAAAAIGATALRRRSAARRVELAEIEARGTRRRIDVVALDAVADSVPDRQRNRTTS
jgi:hypothetical protein